MTRVASAVNNGSSRDNVDVPAFARKNNEANAGGEVIKLKKLSVLSSAEDDEKYEIPTFLRKQAD